MLLIVRGTWPSSAMASSRACWTAQLPVGWAATPRRCTRRVEISMTTLQFRRRSNAVSTWKKSTARIPEGWLRRNCAQVGPERRGAGAIPALFRIAHTVEAPTGRPARPSSPAILRYPSAGSPWPSSATAPVGRAGLAVGLGLAVYSSRDSAAITAQDLATPGLDRKARPAGVADFRSPTRPPPARFGLSPCALFARTAARAAAPASTESWPCSGSGSLPASSGKSSKPKAALPSPRVRGGAVRHARSGEAF